MFSPYNEARRRFLKYWPYMSIFEKSRAVYLVSGERFWKWIGDRAQVYTDVYKAKHKIKGGEDEK